MRCLSHCPKAGRGGASESGKHMTSTPDVRDQPAETEARRHRPETRQRAAGLAAAACSAAAELGLAGLAAGAAGGFALGSQEAASSQPQAAGNAYLSLLRGAPGGHSHSGARSTALRRI